MKCTFDYNGQSFETINDLCNYLRNKEGIEIDGKFSIFSMKNTLSSASSDVMPTGKNYKRNQAFLETGGLNNTYLVSSKTGKQLVAIYNVENRIKNEMDVWLEKHPMNKEGDTDYNSYYDLIKKQIQEDELKGKFFANLHSLIKYKLQDSTSYLKQLNYFIQNISPIAKYKKSGITTYIKKSDITSELVKEYPELEQALKYDKYNSGFKDILFSNSSLFKYEGDYEQDYLKLTFLISTVLDNLDSVLKSKSTGYIAKKFIRNDVKLAKQPVQLVSDADFIKFGETFDGHETVSVFRIVGGGNDYNNWDSAKKQRYDYMLGVDRIVLEANGVVGTPTNPISLNIIPILYDFGNIETITIGDIQNRNNPHVKSGLNPFGEITVELEKYRIIPPTIKVEENDDKFLTIANDIEKLTKGKWSPKIDYSINDTEAVIQKILQNKTEDGKYTVKKYNGFKIEYVKVDTEAEVRETIIKWREHLENSKGILVSNFTDSFIKLKNQDHKDINVLFSGRSSEYKKFIKINLEKYLNNDWEIIDTDIFKRFGMLVFMNRKNSQIDIINITSEYNLETPINIGDDSINGIGDTIFGAYIKNDKAYRLDPNVPIANVGNLEICKALTVLNNIPEFFETSQCKIGTIKCLSISNNVGFIADQKIIKAYVNLTNLAQIEINKNLQYLSSEQKIKGEIYTLLQDKYNTNTFKKVDSFFTNIEIQDIQDNQAKKDLLEKLMKELISSHPHLNTTITEDVVFDTEEKLLFAMLSYLHTIYSGQEYQNEPGLSEYGLEGSNVKQLLTDFYTYNQSRINSRGIKNVGILQGAAFTGATNNPSINLFNVLKRFNASITQVRNLTSDECDKIEKITSKFYQQNGISNFQRFTIGYQTNLHKDLFEKKADGKTISDELKVKNPFLATSKLTTFQKEYLKEILWQINKFKISGLTIEQLNKSFKEVENLESVQKAIQKDEYFKIPLKRASDSSKVSQMTISNIKQIILNKVEEFKDVFDPRQISKERKKHFNDNKNKESEYPDLYQIDDMTRDKFLQEKDTSYWEINLDIIAMDVAFNAAKRNVFNKLLFGIKAITTTWKYLSYQTQHDITPLLEFLENQIKITIYNENLIKEELSDVAVTTASMRTLSSLLNIAVRGTMVLKELSIGFLNAYALAVQNKLIDKDHNFGLKDLTKSYGIIFGHIFQKGEQAISSDDSISKFTLVNQLNNRYGIANMDLNTIINKLKTDRFGMFAGMSKWLFWTTTYGDFINRMTMFLAYMEKDGCLEAHSIIDGKFVYDMSKDKRFDEYYKHRNDPNYTSVKFRKQKALYEVMMSEFISEDYKKPNGEFLKLGDDLPLAYTTRQRDNIKERADTVYGCYDNELKSQVEHKIWGLLWMQFKTFWPGAMRRWMAPSGTATSKGFYEQMKFEDGSLAWKKPIFDEHNNFIRMDIVKENPNNDLEPAYDWKGDYMEGIAVSFIKTVRDLGYTITNTLGITQQPIEWVADEEVKNVRKGNLFMGIYDLLLGYLLGNLIYLIFFGKTKDELKESNKIFTEEEQAYLKLGLLAEKIGSELNITQIQPFTSWTPPQISTASRVVNSSIKFITDEDYEFKDYIIKNIAGVRDFADVELK